MPVCSKQPTTAPAAATHMNANILTPTLAWMLICAPWEVMTLRNTMKSTVAMMEAAVVVKAQRKERNAIGTVRSREYMLRGVMKMQRKESGAETRKSPNMTCEACLTRPSAVRISFGSATTNGRQLCL